MDYLPWIDGRPPELWVVALLMAVALGLLFDGYLQLRKTTLAAAVLWSVPATMAIVVAAIYTCGKGIEIYGASGTYLASVLLIAPTLAMLGAKRPQNGAWQFIVLTLMVVLVLPLLRGWFLDEGTVRMPTMFQWLVVVHIVVGIVNYLPTRFAIPALLNGGAQFALAELLLESGWWNRSQGATFAAAGVTAALAWIWLGRRRRSESAPGSTTLWRDFRDAYGLVWGLRIAERLNASALKHGWPVEFTWGGMLLREGTTQLDPETQHRVERELRSHLRRFVSHDWIARRLNEPRA